MQKILLVYDMVILLKHKNYHDLMRLANLKLNSNKSKYIIFIYNNNMIDICPDLSFCIK